MHFHYLIWSIIYLKRIDTPPPTPQARIIAKQTIRYATSVPDPEVFVPTGSGSVISSTDQAPDPSITK